jgi:hypothetical protein
VVTDRRLALAGLVIVANLAALGMLSARLLAPSTSGGPLLLGAMQVWNHQCHRFRHLYVSLTNSSAFSPTDTMARTSRGQGVDGLQTTARLLASLLVIARAVGSLGGGSG